MKTISARQYSSIKRIYMNVNPLIVKKNKLISKINELTEEIAQINDEIEGNEMGIKTITNGLSSEELIVKKVIDTGKVDKNGSPIKTTKYEPNPERLQWDDINKAYILIMKEEDFNDDGLKKIINPISVNSSSIEDDVTYAEGTDDQGTDDQANDNNSFPENL